MRALLIVAVLGLTCAACLSDPAPLEKGPFTYKVDIQVLDRPLLVGTVSTIDVMGFTPHVSHTVSSSSPDVIAVSAGPYDLDPFGCPFIGCSTVAHFDANALSEGTTDVSFFSNRGLVTTLPLAAHVATNVELRVWDGADRIQPSADDPPTFTVKQGKTLQLGWDLLDSAGGPLIGTRPIDFSSSNDLVLSVTSVLGTIFSLVAVTPGKAELTVVSGDLAVPFEFVVLAAI